jgi:uncharacterized membrane protein
MTAQTTQRVSVAKARKRRGLKGLFITGLIFILPLYITWILVKLVVAWLKDLLHDTFSLLFRLTFGNFLGEYYARIEWVFLFLIGLPIVLAFIIIVGWAAQNLLGKRILAWAERTAKKIPLLGGIYSASRQLVDTVFLKGKESYKRVVMVEYPRRGCWVLAFVTGESSRRIPRIPDEKGGVDGEGHLNVFVPTTPNPTSGFLVFFKKSDVIPLDISVEDGLKLVISGGILEPGVPAPGEPPPPAKNE